MSLDTFQIGWHFDFCILLHSNWVFLFLNSFVVTSLCINLCMTNAHQTKRQIVRQIYSDFLFCLFPSQWVDLDRNVKCSLLSFNCLTVSLLVHHLEGWQKGRHSMKLHLSGKITGHLSYLQPLVAIFCAPHCACPKISNVNHGSMPLFQCFRGKFIGGSVFGAQWHGGMEQGPPWFLS